jgi:hypothetical protein
MWEFSLIELLTYYSWSIINNHLHGLQVGKSDVLKYLLNMFIHLYGF